MAWDWRQSPPPLPEIAGSPAGSRPGRRRCAARLPGPSPVGPLPRAGLAGARGDGCRLPRHGRAQWRGGGGQDRPPPGARCAAVASPRGPHPEPDPPPGSGPHSRTGRHRIRSPLVCDGAGRGRDVGQPLSPIDRQPGRADDDRAPPLLDAVRAARFRGDPPRPVTAQRHGATRRHAGAGRLRFRAGQRGEPGGARAAAARRQPRPGRCSTWRPSRSWGAE